MTNDVSGKAGNQGGFASSLPRIPSTVELYDLLMREIEPELLTTSIAGLALKYRRETPEQANERAGGMQRHSVSMTDAWKRTFRR